MPLNEIEDVVVMHNKYIMSLSKILKSRLKVSDIFIVYDVNKSYISI